MSAKEAVMQLIRAMPDQASLQEIIAALEEARATEEALRRFDERGGIPDEDLTDEEWMATVCRSLAADLQDPRQDIYSLADEGGPADEAR